MLVDTERDGFKYKVQVPDSAPKHMWHAGVVVGPPDLSGLDLPVDVRRRLNNELFVRGLITQRDTRKKVNELQAALMSALRVDVSMLMEAYASGRPNK